MANFSVPKPPQRRDPETGLPMHERSIMLALLHARLALVSAEQEGHRTDCLRAAVRELQGALRCVREPEPGDV